MEAKWSSLVSYGMSLDALTDFLPLDVTLDVKTVRYDTLKVAKRLEAELGDEQLCFITGSPSEWDRLPLPHGAFKVGMDGGYVRNWFAKKHNFEVIVGKSTHAFGEDEEAKKPSSKRFGFVQTLDTKPKRRLYEALHAQGLQMNQEIAFLSDGDDTLRALQREMSPQATHILQISPDFVVKLKPLILLRLLHNYSDAQTLFKRHGEPGNHDVSGFRHLRPIGPPRNSMESSMKTCVFAPSHETGIIQSDNVGRAGCCLTKGTDTPLKISPDDHAVRGSSRMSICSPKLSRRRT
jgi:hypothetical protein